MGFRFGPGSVLGVWFVWVGVEGRVTPVTYQICSTARNSSRLIFKIKLFKLNYQLGKHVSCTLGQLAEYYSNVPALYLYLRSVN